jgi:HD-GYP domain-containing protein (c-di-GMP phosphodiesterase class II)
MDELIKAIGTALDIVESELLGVSTNHGKRIAALCSLMGKELGMDEEDTKAVTTCALFHDNALTEYILSERAGDWRGKNFRLHCEYGQRNIEKLPFKSDISGLVLYHHEQADGGGPFGKREGEFPLGAELIAIADIIDAGNHLQRVSAENLAPLQKKIGGLSGKRCTKRAAEAMLSVLNAETLASLRDENINKTTALVLPAWHVDLEDEALMRLAGLTARIIDYKSAFTKKHSVQIANRAWLMGGYYGFDPVKRAKTYLAAAMHDLGKLATPNAILDKPGKLTSDEFNIIKAHVKGTYDILSGITGFEDVCDWASNHHEKFDGTGYWFGKQAEELDFVSRLLCCTDIYQAVSEERPYHPQRGHSDTMPILWNMAQKGYIDDGIVKDFDTVMAEYSNRDVPPPRTV